MGIGEVEVDGGRLELVVAEASKQLHGLQERVGVHVRPERERREKRRDELAEMPVPLSEEVEAAVIARGGRSRWIPRRLS